MLGMNMENAQGDFSLVEPGGPIDFVAQIYSLPFRVMRNIQAYNDPDARDGTVIGHLMNKEGGLMSIFGNNQPQGDGLIGNGFVSSTPDVGGYGYDTYNYGNEDIGVEHTGGNTSAQSDYSNVSWGDMTESDASSWDDY